MSVSLLGSFATRVSYRHFASYPPKVGSKCISYDIKVTLFLHSHCPSASFTPRRSQKGSNLLFYRPLHLDDSLCCYCASSTPGCDPEALQIVDEFILTTQKPVGSRFVAAENVSALLHVGFSKEMVFSQLSSSRKLRTNHLAADIIEMADYLDSYDIRIVEIVNKQIRSVGSLLEGDCVNGVLGALKDFGVKNLSRILQSNPTALSWNSKAFDEKVRFVEENDIVVDGKFLEKWSCVFNRKLDTISGNLNMLKEMMGEEMAMAAIKRYPRLLGIKAESAEMNILSLKALLGEEDAVKAIVACPSLLIAKKSTQVQTLKELINRFGTETVWRMLDRYPNIVGLSWDKNLAPTLDYLFNEIGMTVEEVAKKPQTLSLSLERRIKPRYKASLESGILLTNNIITVLHLSEAKFQMYLKKLENQRIKLGGQ